MTATLSLHPALIPQAGRVRPTRASSSRQVTCSPVVRAGHGPPRPPGPSWCDGQSRGPRSSSHGLRARVARIILPLAQHVRPDGPVTRLRVEGSALREAGCERPDGPHARLSAGACRPWRAEGLPSVEGDVAIAGRRAGCRWRSGPVCRCPSSATARCSSCVSSSERHPDLVGGADRQRVRRR